MRVGFYVTGSADAKTVTVVWKDHNVQWKSGILFKSLFKVSAFLPA